MSARRYLLCALVLAACATNEIRDPSEFTPASRLPDEALFGTIFHDGSQLRFTTVSSTFKTGAGLVYIYEGAGWDNELVFREAEASVYRIDPTSGAGTKVAAPPLPPTERHAFGIAMADGSAVLILGRADSVDVAYFDGSAWSTTPGPTGVTFSLTKVVARSPSQLLLYTYNSVHAFDGSTWRALPLPGLASGNQIIPGPWDDAGARIAFHYNQQQVCTALYTPAELVSGGAPTPTCLDAPNAELATSYAVNGTTSDFQVLARTADGQKVRAVRFAGNSSNVGGAFGDALTTVLLGAPGSTRPLATSYAPGAVDLRSYYPALQVVEGGEVGAKALDHMRARSVCACSRDTDPSCNCFTRDAVVTIGSVDATGSHFGLLVIDDIDARRNISMRMFALPFDGEAFPGPQCDVVCAAPFVCRVDPVNGESSCVNADPTAGKVGAYVTALPADPVTAGASEATYQLTPMETGCAITPDPTLGYDTLLDPFCTYSLDASAPGHVSLHIDGIETGSETEQENIGPYTLARGALLDDTPLDSGGFDLTARVAVSPAGARMLLSVDDEWRWIETTTSVPYFTTTPLLASLPDDPTLPRWVGATRALVRTETLGLALVDDGTVASTLAGTFDLSRAVVARNAAVAIVPAGTAVASAIHPGVSSEATFVSFAGSTLTAPRTVVVDGFGHTIRANGTQAAFFNTNGALLLVDTGSTTTTIPGSWSNRAGLRVALGGASDWMVVAPNTSPDPTAPCETSQLCTVFAQEDLPGDPGDPVTRQTVSLTSRALWGEIAESVGHVAWLERDTSNVAHLYRRDTTTRTTTEIPLGGSYLRDLAHAIVGDKLLVKVPTGIIVLDIATGVSRLESGIFKVGNVTDPEPHVRIDDARRIVMREACELTEATCGLRIYDATTDVMTSVGPGAIARFGVANDRAVDGAITVTTYNSGGGAIRSYALTAGTNDDVEPTFRTSRGRGAPCIVYWREEPYAPTTRRWYCSD